MSAGQSSSKSKAKSQNSAQFDQNIAPVQNAALGKLYDQAANLWSSNYPQLINQQGPSSNYISGIQNAALPAINQQLGGGAYSGLDLGNRLTSSLDQSLGAPSNTAQIYAQMMGGKGNNYADAMKAAYIGDANRATDAMLANLDARAAASGMSGGARHGIAASQGLYDINSNLQRNLAQTGYETFDKDLQNKLNIASMADQNTLARQQMIADMLGQQSNVQGNALANTQSLIDMGTANFAPYMVPWDALSQYANVIGSPTVLSSGRSQGSGSSKGLAQASSAGLT